MKRRDFFSLPAAATGAMLTCAALTGCASWMGAHPLEPPADIASLHSAQSIPVQGAAWPDTNWIDTLGDAQLGALTREALAGNAGLTIVAARLSVAAAVADASRAPMLPVAGASGSGGRSNLSQDLGLPTPVGPTPATSAWSNSGQILGSIAYELDVWGRNRAALAAAVSETRAAEAELQQARIALTAAVALAYNELARELAALDLLQQLASQRELTERYSRSLVDNGLASEVDLIRAGDERRDTQLQMEQLKEQIQQRRHQLAALLGKGPDRGLTIRTPSLQSRPAPGLPANLPATLLGRRPDIVAARWRVEAASQQVSVAKARFYPNVNLAAFANYASLGIAGGGNSTVQGLGVGPAITLPLFDGGALRANLKGQYAQYEGARAAYQQTLVSALGEVADNISSQQALQRQLKLNAEAKAESSRRTALARQAYTAGLASELNLMQAYGAELALRLREADLQAHARELQIGLMKALGGGYQAPATPQKTNTRSQ